MPDRVGQQPQSIKQDHPPVSSLHISLFGDFRLVASETDVPTIADMPRLQSLLAYLLLHRTAPQSRAHLAFLLWPDSTEGQAHTNLRKVLYLLRQTFPHTDSFLHIGRKSLSWQPSTQQNAWTLDVQDFERAVTQADSGINAKVKKRVIMMGSFLAGSICLDIHNLDTKIMYIKFNIWQRGCQDT